MKLSLDGIHHEEKEVIISLVGPQTGYSYEESGDVDRLYSGFVEEVTEYDITKAIKSSEILFGRNIRCYMKVNSEVETGDELYFLYTYHDDGSTFGRSGMYSDLLCVTDNEEFLKDFCELQKYRKNIARTKDWKEKVKEKLDIFMKDWGQIEEVRLWSDYAYKWPIVPYFSSVFSLETKKLTIEEDYGK